MSSFIFGKGRMDKMRKRSTGFDELNEPVNFVGTEMGVLKTRTESMTLPPSLLLLLPASGHSERVSRIECNRWLPMRTGGS